jgi:hypothetical protein
MKSRHGFAWDKAERNDLKEKLSDKVSNSYLEKR